ncbi:MAG: TolC family protein [Bacteriovorax sp.]|nr:TolC family protein [Bacteriovorax sp.]
MSKNNRFQCLVAGVAMIITAQAQALTLHDAVDEALSTSPNIERSKSATEEARWKKIESASGYMPTVAANATYLFKKNYALFNVNLGAGESVVPQIIPNGQFELRTSYPLFEGFSSMNRYSAGRERYSAAENEQKWNEFKTEMDVTLAYYKTLASVILKEVAAQNLKVLQDHLKDVKLFKASGISTNYDVMRVEVQVSNAQTDLLNAEDNINISQQNLLELLGKDTGTGNVVEVTGTLPVLDESIVRNFEKNDIHDRLDIVALKQRVNAIGYSDKADGAFWVPRLSAFGAWQYYNNLNDSLTDRDKYRTAYQIGLQLTWNIFDAGVSFAKSKQSTEQTVQAEKTYRITELKAQKELAIWKRKYNYYASLYKARNADIARSTESMRLAREGQRVGARTNTELLDAEADLYKSQAGTVNAQLGAIEALINLQISIGQKIYTF